MSNGSSQPLASRPLLRNLTNLVYVYNALNLVIEAVPLRKFTFRGRNEHCHRCSLHRSWVTSGSKHLLMLASNSLHRTVPISPLGT